MLELFFIERGLLRTITNKIKNKKTNKPTYQGPTPVLFVLQLLLLVEYSLFFFSREKQKKA